MSGAGLQSTDGALHVADAIAVERLIQALPSQSQLETVEVAFEGAILTNPEVPGGSLDSSAEADKCREMCDMTAHMFHRAWMQVRRLMENGHMFRLRYSTRKVSCLPRRGVSKRMGSVKNRMSWYGVHVELCIMLLESALSSVMKHCHGLVHPQSATLHLS